MVQVSCHRFGNCERFVDHVFQWLHLRHSGQRPPIQFYIDVNFAKFQFGVLATTAGLATSHYVQLVVVGLLRRKKFSSVTSSSQSWCNIRCITDTVWASNTFNFTRQSRAITSLHPAMAGKLWRRLRLSCTQMLGRFGKAKLRHFSCRQHEHRRFG